MNHELLLLEDDLNERTAVLAQGHQAVVISPGDDASTSVVKKVHAEGVKYITVRSVGYDNIDIKKRTNWE